MRGFFIGLVVLLPVALSAQQPIRTGDITLRGLKAADFPRVQKLAENVYTFEQIDPTKRVVTVNNLIVVSSDGVLIVESQGTEENVRKLLDETRKLTPQPVKVLVVGSEHGDHVGGIEAIPKHITTSASPASPPELNGPAENVARTQVPT